MKKYQKQQMLASMACMIAVLSMAIGPNNIWAATATSNVISLVVNDEASFTLQPLDVTVYGSNSDSAVFTITATGDGTLQYQWFTTDGTTNTQIDDGGRISGATTNTLTITDVVAADANDYVCAVTTLNGAGPSTLSNTATLTVYSLPSVSVVSTPAATPATGDGTLTVNPGVTNGVVLTATATGGWGAPPALTLTWEKSSDGTNWSAVVGGNGYVISGASGNVLTIDPVAETHELQYRCSVDDGH